MKKRLLQLSLLASLLSIGAVSENIITNAPLYDWHEYLNHSIIWTNIEITYGFLSQPAVTNMLVTANGDNVSITVEFDNEINFLFSVPSNVWQKARQLP